MSELNYPEIGKMAPLFTLLNQDEKEVSLKDFRGEFNVIIYFYPKAMTPGCTVQACALRDSKGQYTRNKTVILGLSPDAPKRLAKFREKESLNFDLLSDEDHQIAESYGVWALKKNYGKEYMGIVRTSFIVGKDGKLKHVMDKVKTKTHHEEALTWVKENL